MSVVERLMEENAALRAEVERLMRERQRVGKRLQAVEEERTYWNRACANEKAQHDENLAEIRRTLRSVEEERDEQKVINESLTERVRKYGAELDLRAGERDAAQADAQRLTAELEEWKKARQVQMTAVPRRTLAALERLTAEVARLRATLTKLEFDTSDPPDEMDCPMCRENHKTRDAALTPRSAP